MTRHKKILKKLKSLKLDAETKLFFKKYGSLITRLRSDSTFQARLMHGIIIPPHERAILRPTRWDRFNEYHLVGSRGIAKSFCIASMYPTLDAESFGKRKILTLSASKFRGGKVIMEEALSLIMGNLSSQRPMGPFSREMLIHHRGLKREADRWHIDFTTHSSITTIPTGNEESARGLRANRLILDEADNWEKQVVDKIFGPFLAVGTDFENPGSKGSGNKIFFGGTVSHSHKDWAAALKDRERVIRKQWIAYKDLMEGNFESYNNSMTENNERLIHATFSMQRWDYTDLIIPSELGKYKINYPSMDREVGQIVVNNENLIQYDPRDKKDFIYTYPVDKEFAEKQLDDGLSDFDSWAAEWRCQFIDSSGNVYPFELIEKATSTELLNYKECKALGWDANERGLHYPPLLYECEDPCVLGVDPARTSDFSGFVVIRIGELAKGNYNPLTGTGFTPWNNVIWAEQRRQMTIKDMAQKILELKERYNLITDINPDRAPGITIDARGAMAGTTVRDELARPSALPDDQGNLDPNWVAPDPIYDPTDKEYVQLSGNPKAWPGLRLLWTDDKANTNMVSFSKGQLEQNKLFISKYLGSRERYETDPRMDVGYIGVRSLVNQLVAIQGEPTKYAFKYDMPGNTSRVDMKKDLFSAFLYATQALRDHLVLLTRNEQKAPVAAAVMVRPGGKGRFSLFDNGGM